MKSTIKTIILLFLGVFLISGTALAATRFLLVSPGESYNPASGASKNGTPTSQVSGVPFNVQVYSVDDSTWLPVNTNEQTTLAASQTSSYNPTVPFFLNEDIASPFVVDCVRSVTITVDTSVASLAVTYTATGPSGILSNTLLVPLQKISSLQFGTITTPQTAGTGIPFTITAIKNGGGTATAFTGAAACVTISAVYSGQYTVPVAVATFTNGVASGNIILYDATEGSQTVALSASITASLQVPPALSGNFTVNPAVATQLLLIGPGQSIAPGLNSGNGRTGTGSILETAITVTAGSGFNVTVYAVDAYWNTVTTATGNVTLSSTDPLATTPAAAALSSGIAVMNVTMGTAGTTVLTAAHTGVTYTPYASDVDNIPVTYGALSQFNFLTPMTDITVGDYIELTVLAEDAYGNKVLNFNSAVTIDVLKGGTTALAATHWFSTNDTPSFTNGVLTAHPISIYERLSSCTIRLTYNTVSTTGDSFVVYPGAFSRLIVLAPGETFDPGAGDPVDDAKAGFPSPTDAGSTVPFTVYAVDDFGNMITSVTDTIAITSTDSEGLANGVTPPVQVPLTGGIGSFNFLFMNYDTQTIYVNDVTAPWITGGSVEVEVLAGSISYFDFTSVSSSVTAGVTGTAAPVVNARDSYGNLVESYTGNAWVTSPDTDWTLPAESTVYITNGTAYGAAWYVTFTAGQAPLNISFRRAGSARLFACDDASGTTLNTAGHRGLSTAITVNSNNLNRMQVIPPGMTARPGTIDGFDGAPLGQVVADVFTVTVNACDMWWNVIKTGDGATDTLRLGTSDNANAYAAATGQTLVQVNANTTAGLTAGSALMDVRYDQEQTNFYIVVYDYNKELSVSSHQTPMINIFNVHHFRISGVNTVSVVDEQWVDTYFTITITAEDNSFNRITSFAGVQVELRSSNQDSDSEYTLSPTRSVTFTAGVAIMQVKMYKASTTWTGAGVYIEAKFGNVKSTSNSFNLWWGELNRVLVRIAGMTHKPGLEHIGIPGYMGYSGSPIIVEAGVAFQMEVLYLDKNYNRVLTLPTTYCNLRSSDPLASVGIAPQVNLAGDYAYVTITAGLFSTTSMKLRTVGTTGIQTITAVPGGALLNNVSPEISIRHTTHDHFGISGPPVSSPQVAGVPFRITIQALDAYQNVCDNRNLGVPFNNSVNLLPTTQTNTMYPYIVTLVNGQAFPDVSLYKAPVSNIRIDASYSSITGTSNEMATIPGEYARLLVTDSGYAGMTMINGKFIGTVPGDMYTFPMVSGSPFANNPAEAVVSYKVVSTHYAKVHQFKVFACDPYGNIVTVPELAGNTVTIGINDVYAQPVTPTSISTTYGYNNIDLVFHTAQQYVSVTAHTTAPGIADYTTPTFTTYAGPAFGLQLLFPHLEVDSFGNTIPYVIEGSGRTIGAFANWYNGVSGTAIQQVTGEPFGVTVQAADIFGNFQSATPNNPLRVYVDPNLDMSAYPLSFPTDVVEFTGSLGDYSPGRLTLTATYSVLSNISIVFHAEDLTAPGPANLNQVQTKVAYVPMYTGDDFEFQLVVNNVKFSDGIDVTATAAPATFNVTINIVTSLGNPIGKTSWYRLLPVDEFDLNTPTGATLTVIPSGSTTGTVNMTKTITVSYPIAERMRIMVDNPNPVTPTIGVTTGPRWSAVIDLSANSLNAVMQLTAAPASIGSGQTSYVRALMRDTRGNNIIGRAVYFTFLNTNPATNSKGTFGSIDTLESEGGAPLLTFTAITDSNGIATAPFIGDYDDGKCVIEARYYGLGAPLTATVDVEVSLVDPSTEISNYPNPFMAGEESTFISFYVEEPAKVSVKIYNLMGQIVWEEVLDETQVEALIETNGHMITREWDGKNGKGKVVGNGGYIAAIEAGTSKYKRKIAVRK